MESCIYEGWVMHHRFAPVVNSFRYAIFMMYLDLDELADAFRGRWLWSAGRPNVAWLRRKDHFGDPSLPLKDAVAALVREKTGRSPEGPIRMLTHLRYFGHCFNPVTFYYCFDAPGRRVWAVVAEITNTPWKERFLYVLGEEANLGTPERQRFRFPKVFHVSPFMGMDYIYEWTFAEPGETLRVDMSNEREGLKDLHATLCLARREISPRALASVLARHPFMTVKVVAAIHGQAFRLWRKGAPFFSHPAKRAAAAAKGPP